MKMTYCSAIDLSSPHNSLCVSFFSGVEYGFIMRPTGSEGKNLKSEKVNVAMINRMRMISTDLRAINRYMDMDSLLFPCWKIEQLSYCSIH
jgi:hypothetical protein